jgi:hypothetical protein
VIAKIAKGPSRMMTLVAMALALSCSFFVFMSVRYSHNDEVAATLSVIKAGDGTLDIEIEVETNDDIEVIIPDGIEHQDESSAYRFDVENITAPLHLTVRDDEVILTLTVFTE